jgi:hypothetical protein
MDYYLITPDVDEPMFIGTASINNIFWADSGFEFLEKLVDTQPDLTEHIIIRDHTGKKYTVLEFFKLFTKGGWKLRSQTT